MHVAIREASAVLVEAPADAVARLLQARGARSAGAHRFILGGKPATKRGLAARREAWYVLSDAPGGTNVVHGVAIAPANLAEDLAARFGRAKLVSEVERHLADLKREAERSVRRAFAASPP